MKNKISREAVERIEALLATAESAGLSTAAIAKLAGVSPVTVRTIRRGEHFHQQTAEEQARRLGASAAAREGQFLPTPQEIRRQCRRFRKLAPRPNEYRPAPVEFNPAPSRVFVS